MKIFSCLVLTLSLPAFAQSVDIKDVPTSSDDSTTIEITKGKTSKSSEPTWEIVEGSAPIEGDPSAMNKDARTSWQKACDDWKKELREDNKENRIISVNCGKPNCSGTAGNKICSSEGSYKIKTKID